MTAGTVVITGGILATVILLCIIAVLCYCRLQVHLFVCLKPELISPFFSKTKLALHNEIRVVDL